MPGILPPIKDLGSLHKLDRKLLWVFVCGPGVGEAIVVALPGRGWLVLDGAGKKDDYPAHWVLDQFSPKVDPDPIDALILTHPHKDHYHGFTKLLDKKNHLGRRVARVALVRDYVDTELDTLEKEADRSRTGVDPDEPKEANDRAEARKVLREIAKEWKKKGQPLVAPMSLATSSGAVDVAVVYPEAADIAEFFREDDGLDKRLRDNVNDLSVVIQLDFDRCRLLLSADLGEPHHWDAVVAAHPGLNGHTAWKIPHHGSERALHAGVMTRAAGFAGSRVWAVTPFQSQGLPREEALRMLLAHEAGLHLSGRSCTIENRYPLPERMTVDELPAAPDLDDPLLADLYDAEGISLPIRHDHCIWAFALHPSGEVVQRFRGPAATLVVS